MKYIIKTWNAEENNVQIAFAETIEEAMMSVAGSSWKEVEGIPEGNAYTEIQGFECESELPVVAYALAKKHGRVTKARFFLKKFDIEIYGQTTSVYTREEAIKCCEAQMWWEANCSGNEPVWLPPRRVKYFVPSVSGPPHIVDTKAEADAIIAMHGGVEHPWAYEKKYFPL